MIGRYLEAVQLDPCVLCPIAAQSCARQKAGQRLGSLVELGMPCPLNCQAVFWPVISFWGPTGSVDLSLGCSSSFLVGPRGFVHREKGPLQGCVFAAGTEIRGRVFWFQGVQVKF